MGVAVGVAVGVVVGIAVGVAVGVVVGVAVGAAVGIAVGASVSPGEGTLLVGREGVGEAVGAAVWHDLNEYNVSPFTDLMTRYFLVRLEREVIGTAPDPFALLDCDRV